ncbi:MAG: hypothetical protein ACRDDH_00035 [Cetobacterium sp.]|uniref:hypothetical protein n=1 Tax=Cetobacterium sp. TaxID=2071632 RepID=UPI003EE574EE
MSRAEKKKIIFSQVVNYLKTVKPNLDYDILPQAGIEIDPNISELSSDKKNLQSFRNALKIPILIPFKNAIDELTSSQKKKDVDALDKALETAKLIVTSEPEKPKKKKKSSSVDSVLVNATPVISKKKKRVNSEPVPSTSYAEPSTSKKNKTNLGQKKNKEKSNDDYLSEFDNVVLKIQFNKQVKWWEPYLPSTRDGKKKVTCYCPEREPTRICKGRFGSQVLELQCSKPIISDRCGFLINLKSMSKLNSFMKEKKTLAMPRPQCSCGGEDTVLQIRGTDPKVPVHQLYYFCPSCKACYFFDDYKSQIDKLFEGPKQKKSSAQVPAPEPESESEAIDVDSSDDEQASGGDETDPESEISENEDEESSEDEDGN